MSLQEQAPSHEKSGFTSAETYNTLADNRPENSSQRVGHEELSARADDIITTISSGLREHSLRESIDIARENYGDHADDPLDLQDFSRLLLDARKQADIQGRLNDDRAQLHSNDLSHEERLSVGHHYEMLRRSACEYNHELRNFIEMHSHSIDRQELTDWLTRSSQGRHKWAEGEITGAVSEIGVHAALQGMRELRQVRHGSVDEDLHGFDFVANWQGQPITFDAKTGEYPPLSERKGGHLHLEVSVPRITGLQVDRQGLDYIRGDVRRALQERAGVDKLASHRHFREEAA
jgi:hypothetical protein